MRDRREGEPFSPGWFSRARRERPRPWARALPAAAFAGLLVLTGAVLFHLTRGNTFYADEWSWVLYRRGDDLGTFLRPWNEHMSLVPIALYRLLFATVGLRDYGPYRLMVTAAHLLVAALLLVYARLRVGAVAAAILAAMLLYLGPAWENFLWPFQTAWLISLSAGLGALMMLDRRDRRGDVLACVLIAVALASSGIGLMFALGAVVDVLASRRRWRDAWIFIFALLPYAIWWSQYESPNRGNTSGGALLRHNLPLVPGFAAKAAATGLSAVWGLAGQPTRGHAQQALMFGWPLLTAAVSLLLLRLTQLRRMPPRVAALLTITLSFWVLTAIRRADYSLPYESRYLYVSALLMMLLAAELGQGVALPRPVAATLSLAAVAAIVANAVVLYDAAATFRQTGFIVRAETGALDIGRRVVAPGLVADPWQHIAARSYFATEEAIGTPAASARQIALMPEFARVTADLELIHIHGIRLRPGGPDAARCLALHPGWRASKLDLRVPITGLEFLAQRASASVAIRRFAARFEPLGLLSPARPAVLEIGTDEAPEPWYVQIAATAPVSVCDLRSRHRT